MELVGIEMASVYVLAVEFEDGSSGLSIPYRKSGRPEEPIGGGLWPSGGCQNLICHFSLYQSPDKCVSYKEKKDIQDTSQ